MISLTLYVAGRSARSERARRSLARLCNELLPGGAVLDVVDVLSEPERARRDAVTWTPTVVWGDPAEGPRVFGDLSDPREVSWALGLPQRAPP